YACHRGEEQRDGMLDRIRELHRAKVNREPRGSKGFGCWDAEDDGCHPPFSHTSGYSRRLRSPITFRPTMRLREFFSADAVKLNLEGATKDDALKELIGLLGLDDKSQGMLYKMLKRRENLGSTGIGRGIAIPHCRSLVVSRLRVAFGRKPQGIDFQAIDNKPVYNFFVIVAPPLEVSNQYLPVLGKIAQFAKESDVP